ncbi:MAG TPA: D-alanyl-D-alanine carboxypeptidase/D-alanyl-D-alanine-endopeptidase [Longimicrobiales bacterium]
MDGPTAQPRTLAGVVDSVTMTPPLDRAQWGIEVYDAAADRPLVRRNAGKHFIPASNTKLVVTAVALAELGPEYRFRTDVYVAGAPAGDTTATELVVVGHGDPTLSARFHPTAVAPLEALADSVALAGIGRITGDLVVDVTFFDTVAVHPAWELGDLTWSYAAPTSAFAIAEAAVEVEIAPGAAPGDTARTAVPLPPTILPVHAAVVTDTAGAATTVHALYRPTSDTLYIVGTIPVDAAVDTFAFAVRHPARVAGRAFAAALEARGIEVLGSVRVRRDTARADAEPTPLRRIAAWHSAPLRDIVAAVLKPSQNWIAEQLLKTLGAERAGRGSWTAGLEVERRYLVDVAGIDSTAFYLRDGSGLSAQNLLAPHALVQLLAHARAQPWGAAYRRALPRPGEPETTLEERLDAVAGRVAAKTGTITHVVALSGFARTTGGRELIFSILTNGTGRPSGVVQRGIDRMVSAIVEQGGRE